MSDAGWSPEAPPPPPRTSAPPPPPPPPAGPGYSPPPVYSAPAYTSSAYSGPPPSPAIPVAGSTRPKVTVGASLMLLGGVLAAVGSFVTWFTIEGQSFTGFSKSIDGDTKDGPVFLVMGLVMIGFAVALLAARKVLAVTIIAIVVATLTVLFALADLGTVSDAKKSAKLISVEFSSGAGLYLCLLGGLVALGGSIAATATRRRG